MMLRGILVVMLATSLLAEDPQPESVMERPISTRGEELPSAAPLEEGEEVSPRQSRQLDSELAERQGPLNGMDMVSMTVNALNPMPYIIGGLNGVRGVMRQRFYPWSGLMLNNFQRTLPRPPPHRFRGNGGGGGNGFGSAGSGSTSGRGIHLGHPSNNGGSNDGLHDGGSGGGFRNSNLDQANGGFGRGRRRPFGPGLNNIAEEVESLMTDDPLSTMHHSERPISGFDTPKPHSILSTQRPASFRTTRGPRPIHNSPRPRFIPGTQKTRPSQKPNFGKALSGFQNLSQSFDSNVTPSTEKKKIISIEIPKELQDLTVLEVSMHSNGDVSIGPSTVTDKNLVPTSPEPPITSTATHSPLPHAFLPLFPPYPPGMNEHGFIDKSNPELRHFNTGNMHQGVHSNINERNVPKSTMLCVKSKKEANINSIQDVLRKQRLENINSVDASEQNIELNCVESQQSTSFQSINNFHGNEPLPMQLPRSLLRENPIPHFSANFLPDKQNVNHIYFVPITMPSSSVGSNTQFQSGSSQVTQHVKPISQSNDKDSSVYYIDITIPGNQQEQPLVKTNVARAKRSLQFDGWYPMDVSNPMADDPTIGYQPPPLERVHFSDDPVAKKPMFPVKPKNPTVFVVRAEPKEPGYHSVYGTENVEYFHINPQTNTIRAFRAPAESVGAIQFVSPHQFGVPGENSQNSAFPEASSTKQGLKRDFIYSDITDKESGISDKSDFGDNYDYDQDMVGSFSEYSSVIARPYRWRNGEQPNSQGFRYVQSSSSRRRQDFVDLPPSRESGNRRSSRPALHELLGNFKYESQIEETPYLGSATDSARASIFREVPPPEFFQNRPLRRNNLPKSGPRGPTYRQTGLDADETISRPWYLINTKSERRREPSIASYIHPETRLGDERVHYKPLGPVSYVSKDSEKENEQDPLYNPHLDDHMNSYKPSTSITANSLSELLQIFRFTQVTDKPGKGVTEDPVTFVREFRYTRPTEETPTTHPSFDDNFPTNFRYTSTPSSVDETTIPTEPATEVSKNIQFDAVADTNSLDGYLFSDSEASPEYAHPEVKPNIIIINGKGLESSKGLIKDGLGLRAVASSSPSPVEAQASVVTPKKLEPAFENLEIIYPGPMPRTSTSTSSTWPLYIIHEGHSKVRVFGINSAGEKPSLSKSTINVLSANESSIGTTSPLTSSFISSVTTTPNTLSTTPFLVDHNSTSGSTHTDITNSSTTTVSSTEKLTDYDLVPIGNNDEYEYYYYDESNTPSDMTFGEEYFTERSDQSSPSFENPHLLPTYRLLPGDLALSQEGGSFSQLFQARLPRAENFSPPKSDQIPLIPAVAMTRDQFSVARPVFFTKRQQSSEEVSQPFEYLSHLRQLNREKRASSSSDEKTKQWMGKRQQVNTDSQA